MLEREFGSGEETYGDPRLSLRGKAARGCATEAGRDKLVSDFGRAGGNSMQAIVAHGRFSTVIRCGKPFRKIVSDALIDVKYRSIVCKLRG
jgi:hypothetical protein